MGQLIIFFALFIFTHRKWNVLSMIDIAYNGKWWSDFYFSNISNTLSLFWNLWSNSNKFRMKAWHSICNKTSWRKQIIPNAAFPSCHAKHLSKTYYIKSNFQYWNLAICTVFLTYKNLLAFSMKSTNSSIKHANLTKILREKVSEATQNNFNCFKYNNHRWEAENRTLFEFAP